MFYEGKSSMDIAEQLHDIAIKSFQFLTSSIDFCYHDVHFVYNKSCCLGLELQILLLQMIPASRLCIECIGFATTFIRTRKPRYMIAREPFIFLKKITY